MEAGALRAQAMDADWVVNVDTYILEAAEVDFLDSVPEGEVLDICPRHDPKGQLNAAVARFAHRAAQKSGL
jgi:hypothetical protein